MLQHERYVSHRRTMDQLVMVTSHRIINVSTDLDPNKATSDAVFRVASELWFVHQPYFMSMVGLMQYLP